MLDRNVLEWRLNPVSPYRIPEVTGYDQLVVVMCQDGYASSLVAAMLHDLSLWRATDLVGGFNAWKAAGLPVEEARGT